MKPSFQLQATTVCLECGGCADDELCVGPFLTYLRPEFDPEEFRGNPLDDGHAVWDASGLPRVWDADDTPRPDLLAAALRRLSAVEEGAEPERAA